MENRIIKFRGLGVKGWEYGHLTYEQFGAFDRENHSECNNEDFLIYSKEKTGISKDTIAYGYKIHLGNHQSSRWVKHKTIGQFIGKKDEHNSEIYEGDIVEDDRDGFAFVIEYRIGNVGLGSGDSSYHCGFAMKKIKGEWANPGNYCDLSPSGYRIEVVGDIHRKLKNWEKEQLH